MSSSSMPLPRPRLRKSFACSSVINTGSWVSYVDAYSVDAKFTTYAVCHT